MYTPSRWVGNMHIYTTQDILRMPHPLQENDVKNLTLQELRALSSKIREVLSLGRRSGQFSAMRASFDTLQVMISERSWTGVPPSTQRNPLNPNQMHGAWPGMSGTPAGAAPSTNDGHANGPGMQPNAYGTVPNSMRYGEPLRAGRREPAQQGQHNPQPQPHTNQTGAHDSSPFANNFDTPKPSESAATPQGNKHGDLYTILGLTPEATHEDIVQEGKRMKAHWHPDRNKEPNAEEEFKKVNEATEVLSDPRRRKCYDAIGQTSEGAYEEWENASRGMGGRGGPGGRDGRGHGGGYGGGYGGRYGGEYCGYGGYRNFYGGGYRRW